MKARILPFLEQAALYNTLNQSFFSCCKTNPAVNTTTIGVTVNGFLCPSDGNDPNFTTPGTPAVKAGSTNYANNIGLCLSLNGNTFDGPAYRIGTPSSGGPTVTLASIKDGTSNTAMWSEWIKGKNTPTKPGIQSVWTSTLTYSNSATSPSPANLPGGLQPTLQAVATACQPSMTTSATWDQKGAMWANDMCGSGGGYSHLLAPNKPGCFFAQYTGTQYGATPGNDDITIIGAQSNHSGGVNVGMLDGSVKFVKSSVSLQTWGSIATKDGGEIVDASSL